MKEYTKFFRASIIIGLLCGGIFIVLPKIFSPFISDSDHYVASTVEKEARLKKLESPKIVIIGGSGSAYSVDSQILKDSLNMPVVNMAVAYGLGLHFMLEEVKPAIKKGDFLLIIPEYYLPLDGNIKLLTLVNDLNPNAKSYFNFDLEDWLRFHVSNFQRVGSTLFYTLKNREKLEITQLKTAFNEDGDMVAHLNMPDIRPLKDNKKLYEIPYSKEIEALNNFANYAKTKGATALLSFAAYPNTEFEANKEAITVFENNIKKQFLGQVINSASSNLYHEKDFYDTIYHLNKNGRAKRSQYLAQILKENIKKAQKND